MEASAYRVPLPPDDEPAAVQVILYRHGFPCLVTFRGSEEVACEVLDSEHGAIARLLGAGAHP